MSPRTEETNQRIREEQRQHILHAARKLFAHRGLIATKMTDIANAADVSYGLAYHYFKNKEEIFTTLVERALDGTVSIMEQARSMPGTPLDRITWLGSQMLEGLKDQPDYTMLVLQTFTSEAVPQRLRERALEQSMAFLDTLRQLIVEGQEAGQIVAGNPDYLASAFSACMQGLAVGHTFYGSVYPVYPDLNTIMHLLKP
ncbi:MAG TPA: TetR/AcrR family transcriptional regulator [Ktedonobacteraceae bacterium]|jgi:AcrR family transcriptional regulator|nr:TetR/AcrR family transcriptional regulator [Ktedonobacteraceae bacterium]